MKNFVSKKTATVRGGVPELYVDGKKTAPIWYALSDFVGARPDTDYAKKNIAAFGKAGINVVCGDCALHSGWKENGPFDPTDIFKEVDGILEAAPQARVVIRLHVNAPYRWMRKNPDELIGYYKTETTDGGDYGERLIASDRLLSEMRASYASEKFLSECGDKVTECCTLMKERYGERLLGVQAAYGTCGEWHWWGRNNEKTGAADYGKAMLSFFRKYLKSKYKTNEALKKAYGTDETFDNVRLATPEERFELSDGRYRFQQKNARALDTLFCMQRSMTEAIIAFCKAIKRADGDILAGSFYGYYFGAGDAAECGMMFDNERLFSDDSVDFLAATAPYGKNKRSGNFYMCRNLAESMRLNGKLFLCEMDQGYKCHSYYRDDDPYFECESEEEYASVLKRNIFENVLRGGGAWFYDHRLRTDDIHKKVGYWDKPERMETIARIYAAAQKIAQKPFVKTTDVLIVFDTERFVSGDSFFKNGYDSFDFLDAVMKSGAGIDFIGLSDLKKVELDRYKCVIFIECVALTGDEYEYIDDKVKSGGRTVVFEDKCGYIKDGVPSEENFGKLVRDCAYMPKPICDDGYYRELFRKSGAHIYAENGEVTVADGGFVMVHCKNIPHTILRLPCGDVKIDNGKYNTVVYDATSGERIL